LSGNTIKEVLKNFGLTQKETEIYIFLAKHGVQKGGEISKRTKTPKAVVYRILKILQRKGFVESTLEFPARFTAVPFETVLDLNIRAKHEEALQIEKAKKDLLSDWRNISKGKPESPIEKFVVIEGNRNIFAKIFQMIKETKSSFSAVATVTGLLRADRLGVFEAIYANPFKSKVQFRFLTDLTGSNLKTVKFLKRSLRTDINLRGRNPELGLSLFPKMVIQDDKEIILFISDEKNMTSIEDKQACLCTNCKSIIQAFQGVFEDLWLNSTDIEKKIIEIETGKPTPKMSIIKDEKTAEKMYFDALNRAAKEILIVTSSRGLIGLSKNINKLKNWSKNGVSIKIMAPIMSENLGDAYNLLEFCEVRHIPVGYTETVIIDGQNLFQFHTPLPEHEKKREVTNFQNVFFTNDSSYVKHTKDMLSDIWRKTHAPSDVSMQFLPFSEASKSELHQSLKRLDRYGRKKIEYNQTGRISEKDVLDKISEAKKNPSENWSHTRWSDTLRFYGTRALAIIRPPDYFELPDIVIAIFQNIEPSSFGAENILKVFSRPEMTTDAPYQLVAHVQDNPKAMKYREALLAGMPAEKNIKLVNKGQLNVRVHGNTLFAGWTVPVPLIPSKYVLPPSCILFEGYGDVRSGIFDFVFPSGRKQEVWFNDLEAFVTFFHPLSKYVGSGTEGMLDRESVQISYAPNCT
jgi:sugar-specific transcriptional regulator TrmB